MCDHITHHGLKMKIPAVYRAGDPLCGSVEDLVLGLFLARPVADRVAPAHALRRTDCEVACADDETRLGRAAFEVHFSLELDPRDGRQHDRLAASADPAFADVGRERPGRLGLLVQPARHAVERLALSVRERRPAAHQKRDGMDDYLLCRERRETLSRLLRHVKRMIY